MRPNNVLLCLLATAALALIGVGCGDDDESSSDGGGATTPDAGQVEDLSTPENADEAIDQAQEQLDQAQQQLDEADVPGSIEEVRKQCEEGVEQSSLEGSQKDDALELCRSAGGG